MAHRHGALAERVILVGQRVAARVQRDRYGQRADVRRARRDRDGRDGGQVLGRIVVQERLAVCRRRRVRRQAARFHVRVHEPAERPGAGVREHVVVRRHVVVLVAPAHRHRALETVALVRERRGQRVVLVRVRLCGPHDRYVEVLETVVREEPATAGPRRTVVIIIHHILRVVQRGRY